MLVETQEDENRNRARLNGRGDILRRRGQRWGKKGASKAEAEKLTRNLPGGPVIMNPPSNAGDAGLIPDPWSGNEGPTCSRAAQSGECTREKN